MEGGCYGFVWSERDETTEWLRFQRLDADGEPLTAPTQVFESEPSWISDFVAVGDGFAVVLGRSMAEENRRMWYLGFGADGRPYWGPVPFADWDVALIRRDDRVLAAWSHSLGSGLGASIRIAWFSERGQPEGNTSELQAPTFYEDNSDPAWVELGDDLGLVWSRGHLNGSCWECVEDDHLEFVVLDGQSLEPKSNVVTVERGESLGTLTESMLASTGGDVTIVTNIATHRFLEGAVAGVTCQ